MARLAVFILPLFIPLDLASTRQRRRLDLFLLGTIVYLAASLPLLLAPRSAWSTSLWGFAPPAYTPLPGLLGFGLLGRRLYRPLSYRPWAFLVLAMVFIALHMTHVVMVHTRSIAVRTASPPAGHSPTMSLGAYSAACRTSRTAGV